MIIPVDKAPSQKECIWFALDWRHLKTAAEICELLRQQGVEIKMASLSSALNKMAIAGEITRVRGVGPRGGAGYIRRSPRRPALSMSI